MKLISFLIEVQRFRISAALPSWCAVGLYCLFLYMGMHVMNICKEM